MAGKRKKGAGKAAPRAYDRLTRHERDRVQRMLERGASCRRIARELGRSPSTDGELRGPEFADEGAIAGLLGEGPGETRLFYCDPGRSDQKGACVCSVK